LKIGLRRPVLPNCCQQILQLTVGNRRALCDGRQREGKEDSINKGPHAPILCGHVKFSKCIASAAGGELHGRQRETKEDPIDEGAHALILCSCVNS
jgi:hypothetical protein